MLRVLVVDRFPRYAVEAVNGGAGAGRDNRWLGSAVINAGGNQLEESQLVPGQQAFFSLTCRS